MKIAYISFEYPPDTAVGGIATYVYQASKMMKDRGHVVEVFCASDHRSGECIIEGITVHHVLTSDTARFPHQVVPVFSERHQIIQFDVIESPEYKGDGYYIKQQFPKLPLVVKLHTPDYLLAQLHNTYATKIPLQKQINYYMGNLLKGRIPVKLYEKYNKESDIDYKIAKVANQIHTPSISLGDITSRDWHITRDRIYNVPYPYVPNDKYLRIPIGGANLSVTYLGRLETRKGIIELTKALPQIIKAFPNVKINLVGRVCASIVPGMDMKEYIISQLGDAIRNVNFLSVNYTEIPKVLSETDVCVFPSLWENFPNVCLEAMSAGRAIVGSKEGGMKDMLEDPACGILIDPRNPDEIANAIITLLSSEELRTELGTKARAKIQKAYNTQTIGDLTEAYLRQLTKK